MSQSIGRRAASLLTTLLMVGTALVPWSCRSADTAPSLDGDWDYYRMLGAAPNGGFEARRRFGFAHFEGEDPARAWLHRRAGGTLEIVTALARSGDSLTVEFAS
ncbi:MAG: hypothetical protein OEZ37_12010, partial [Gemmatimonadota bacterium]|nr:hypothetical protein [Gemmatimonadota bacterium]